MDEQERLVGSWPQALELATWGALLKAPRAVLAGDHLQLPPTIISDEAAAQVRPLTCVMILLHCRGCQDGCQYQGAQRVHYAIARISAMPPSSICIRRLTVFHL